MLPQAHHDTIKAMSDADLVTLEKLCKLRGGSEADDEVCRAVARERQRRLEKPQKVA